MLVRSFFFPFLHGANISLVTLTFFFVFFPVFPSLVLQHLLALFHRIHTPGL